MQLLRVVYSILCGQNFFFYNCKNILASALKSCIKWLLYVHIYIIFFGKFEKIGYHSNFDFECNTERGSIESLSPKFIGPSGTPGESSGVPILTVHRGILFHTQSCLTSVVVRSRRGSHLHSHRKTIAASVSKVGN